MNTIDDNAVVLKRWEIGDEWLIERVRYSDGEVAHSVMRNMDFDDEFETLGEAREYVREQRNQAALDAANDLLGDLDLSDKATARKLAAIIAHLKK